MYTILCIYDLGIMGNRTYESYFVPCYNFSRRFRERHAKKINKCGSRSKQAPLQLVLRRRRPRDTNYGAALWRPARSDTDGMASRLPRLPRRKLRGAGAVEEHTNEEGCENNIEHAALCVQSCSPPHEQVLKIQPRHLCVVFIYMVFVYFSFFF